MTDMQTAVEALARELSCDTEEEWADRVNYPEAAAGAETFRITARRILADIAPLIRAPDPLLAEALEALRDIAAEISVEVPVTDDGVDWHELYTRWRKIACDQADRARAVLAKEGR